MPRLGFTLKLGLGVISLAPYYKEDSNESELNVQCMRLSCA